MMKSLLLSAAILALGCAGQASAAVAASGSAQSVSTANVNFRDQAAVRSLYERIERAAYRACDPGWPNARLNHHDQICIGDAVDRAVLSANRPMLTALHDTSGTVSASR